MRNGRCDFHYRLYFIVVSEVPNPTPEQRNRQLAHLRRIGLQNSDLEHMIPALEKFKIEYAQMIARYNAAAEALTNAGLKPDIDTFNSQRDELVARTREELKRVLTKEGVAQLDAHVQNEKRHMKAASEAQ